MDTNLLRGGLLSPGLKRIQQEQKHATEQLHKAVAKGNKVIVQQILEAKPSQVNAVNQHKTLLHVAAGKGHIDIVKLLIESNANLQAVDNRKWTALHWAAYHQEPDKPYQEIAEILLQADQGLLYKTNAESELALHVAIWHSDNLQFIQFLHQKDPQLLLMKGRGNESVLHMAVYKGHKPIIEYLIQQENVDPNLLTDDASTPLHYAVRFNKDLGIIKSVIQSGVDINAQDKEGATALHFAAHEGYNAILKYLLEKEADFQKSDKKGKKALHYAATNGNLTGLLLLLGKGADVNSHDNKYWTALHHASYQGYTEIVKCLLDHKADLYAQDAVLRTAMHFAIIKKHYQVIQTLLEYEESLHKKGKMTNNFLLNVSDKQNATILHYIMALYPNREVPKEHFHIHLEIINKLLHQPVSTRALYMTDGEGNTPLHKAIQGSPIEVIKILLNEDVPLHIRNSVGDMPIHIAILREDEDIITLLLEKSYKQIDQTDGDKRTVLHLAVESGNIAVISLLLNFIEKNFEKEIANKNNSITSVAKFINMKDKDGKTALHVAVENQRLTIDDLLKAGANLYAQDYQGQSVFYLAAVTGNIHIAKMLIEKDTEYRRIHTEQVPLFALLASHGGNAAHVAAYNGHLDMMRLLHNVGIDLNAKNIDGKTPLHVAAYQRSCFSIVKFLIEDAKVNVDLTDNEGKTALHIAIKNDFKSLAQYLLNHGADVNAISNKGWTALHWAVEAYKGKALQIFNEKSLVDILLEKGAKIIADQYNENPFHLAAAQGLLDVLDRLLAYQSALPMSGKESAIMLHHLPNQEGLTPLHLAVLEGHVAVVKRLLEMIDGNELTGVNGNSLLHYLADYGMTNENHKSIATLLLKRGENINKKHEETGDTPLHFSANDQNFAEGSKLAFAQFLLEEGADFEIKNNNNQTPLHIAAYCDNTAFIGLVFKFAHQEKKKVNLSLMMDQAGDNLLHVAVYRDNLELAELLINKIKSSATSSWEDEKTSLLYSTNKEIETPLHRAVILQNREMVELLGTGNLALLVMKDKKSYIPLHYAIKSYDIDMVKCLLKKLAASNPTNQRDQLNAESIEDKAIDIAQNLYSSSREEEIIVDEILGVLQAVSAELQDSVTDTPARLASELLSTNQPSYSSYRRRLLG